VISGREALANIDRAMNEVRRQVAEAEASIADIAQQALEARKAQAEDMKALAQIRLGEIRGVALASQLDRAEQRALEILAERESAQAELNRAVEDVERAARALAEERAAQLARVDAAAKEVQGADAQVQGRLGADPDYRARRERAEEARRLAASAREKAERSAGERDQKGAAYRNDPLFMYLWDRRFGTAEYKSWGLPRLLDGWVARLVGFADARANYARLLELPDRLAEHAAGLEATAESELAILRERDRAARAEDGLGELDGRLAEEQERLDAIDRRIAEAAAARQPLDLRRALFAAGEDDHSRRAIEALAKELETSDLLALRRAAMETPSPDDDRIVANMLARDDETRRQEATAQGIKIGIAQYRERLAELEALRADFVGSRYDQTGSTFVDESAIVNALMQLAAGAIGRRELWRILRDQQRYSPERSNPDFGSGGFGRGTPWGGGDIGDLGDVLGQVGRGRGGFGGGSGGSGSNGGFRTGGGTGGGGGFRTGGGF
jgi:hypothetical protein